MNLGTGIIGAAKPAEIAWRTGGHNGAGPVMSWAFNNVPIGAADASRHVLVYAQASNLSGCTINGAAAAALGNDWFILSVPTGTTCNIVVQASFNGTHAAVEVFTLLNLKSATPIENKIVAFSTTNPKSETISVKKGGAVASVAIGGGLGVSMTWSFGGGLQTDHAGSTNESLSIGGGTGRPAATDSAWFVSATRSGTASGYSFFNISFR